MPRLWKSRYSQDVQRASMLMTKNFPQLTLSTSNLVALDTIRSFEGHSGFQKFVAKMLSHFQANQKAYFNPNKQCNKTLHYHGAYYTYNIKLVY
jgi:hypothetical protein